MFFIWLTISSLHEIHSCTFGIAPAAWPTFVLLGTRKARPGSGKVVSRDLDPQPKFQATPRTPLRLPIGNSSMCADFFLVPNQLSTSASQLIMGYPVRPHPSKA